MVERGKRSAGSVGDSHIVVRSLEESDLDELSRIHLAAFEGTALTRLGTEAVARYYHWLLTGPHDAVALGALDRSGSMLGFCIGGWFRGALSGYLRANSWFLARRLLSRPWLVANPLLRARLVQGVRLRFRRSRRPSPANPDRTSFGLLSIAVDPSSGGRGVGRALVQELERHARARGCRRMHLSVHADNRGAVRFYEKLGFRWDAGDESGRMVKAV